MAVRPVLGIAERDAAGERRGRPSSRPTRPGARSRAWSSTAAASDETYSGRHRRRCPAGATNTAQDPAALRRTTSTRTGSRTAPTRSAATTCSTTARRSSRCRRSRTTRVFQKTLGINDFYFGTDDYEWPIGHIQMVGKSNAEAMKGEEPSSPSSRRTGRLAETAPARGRLLAHDRGPAAARQPRHARRRRQRPPAVHVEQRRGGRPALPRAQEDPEPRRHGRAPRARQELLHAHEHPGRRRRAPGRHVPVRRTTPRRRCSTRTARRTSSTTSTSSTRASSRASAR